MQINIIKFLVELSAKGIFLARIAINFLKVQTKADREFSEIIAGGPDIRFRKQNSFKVLLTLSGMKLAINCPGISFLAMKSPPTYLSQVLFSLYPR